MIGALLVPALTLRDALLAILVGGLIGNAMVGTAGLIGADARVPSMVLPRPARPARLVRPDGPERRPVPRLGNVRADHHRRRGERALRRALRLRGEGRLDDLLGILAAAFALLGPVGFVRRILRRFGVWIVLASLVYLSWWALSEADVSALWNAPAEVGPRSGSASTS